MKESDNNVKLIVLDRLVSMRDSPAHERVLQELVMDVLRVLASPDLEVRGGWLGVGAGPGLGSCGEKGMVFI